MPVCLGRLLTQNKATATSQDILLWLRKHKKAVTTMIKTFALLKRKKRKMSNSSLLYQYGSTGIFGKVIFSIKHVNFC